MNPKAMNLSSAWLRLRLALRRVNPLVVAVMAALLGGALAAGALLGARDRLGEEYAQARRQARAPAPVAPPPAPPSSDQNLSAFYAVLGERRGAERQLKEVFAIAAKHGLSLQQGEYRSSYDRVAKLYTYQVNLPVKGSYGAIWQFAFDTLRALPHVSLDDVSFRRDSIGDANVEARLRMTFYLAAAPGVPQAGPAGASQ
ncbi:hypothetical protein [Massilia sp. DD77]|uniref:hypothetical protein n=1 Tax=Massilia sp. DD77 TaxID=3109349 RepID=UPI002FFF5F24